MYKNSKKWIKFILFLFIYFDAFLTSIFNNHQFSKIQSDFRINFSLSPPIFSIQTKLCHMQTTNAKLYQWTSWRHPSREEVKRRNGDIC